MTRSDAMKSVATVAILAAVYFVAGTLGLQLAYVHASATAVWPCTGIAMAALLVYGYRVWPGILIGAFLVNLTTAGSVGTSIGIAIGNTARGGWRGALLWSTASRTARTRLRGRRTFLSLRCWREWRQRP